MGDKPIFQQVLAAFQPMFLGVTVSLLLLTGSNPFQQASPIQWAYPSIIYNWILTMVVNFYHPCTTLNLCLSTDCLGPLGVLYWTTLFDVYIHIHIYNFMYIYIHEYILEAGGAPGRHRNLQPLAQKNLYVHTLLYTKGLVTFTALRPWKMC